MESILKGFNGKFLCYSEDYDDCFVYPIIKIAKFYQIDMVKMIIKMVRFTVKVF